MANAAIEKIRSPGWCLWPSGRPNFPPGVYFALCLSLMVLSLLETIFITYLLHLATTQPPPMPRWLHSLLLRHASPRKCCPAVPQKENTSLGLISTHLSGKRSLHCSPCLHWPNFPVSHFSNPVSLPFHGYISVLPIGLKEPGKLGGKELGPKEAELNGGTGLTRAQLADLWVQFGHMMDNLLLRIYLLFLASSVMP